QQRDVAVELAVDADAADDLGPVRLDAAVEVVERDAREPAGDGVEEPARDRLFQRVVPLPLPAGDEVGAGFELLDHGRELGGVVLEVGVEGGDVAAAGAGEAGGERGALSVVAPEADAGEAGVLPVQPLDDRPRVVAGTVVHEPHLERAAGPLHRLPDLRRQLGEARGLLVDGDDDGDDRGHEKGRKGERGKGGDAPALPFSLSPALTYRWWRTSRCARRTCGAARRRRP